MKRKRVEDDQDDGKPLGDWVLVSYHCYYGVSFNFVVRVQGKPQADSHPTSARDQAYRWNSYHAARKFQNAHPQLRGYVILNLGLIERQAAEQREIREEWIAGKHKAPAPPSPRSRGPPKPSR